MQVEQESGRVYMHQKDYIKKLLYGMECNSVSMPIDVNVKMDSYADSNKCDQELMGRLIFLSVNTRSDIAYTLSYLSQYNNDAREIHMRVVKESATLFKRDN